MGCFCSSATPPSSRPRLAAHVETDHFFLEQKRSAAHVLANVTFTDSLTVHLGDREIRLLHRDRAVTPGDTYLHLPVERIVVTGDLVVDPIPFALSSYPTGWLRTLEAIDSLHPATIVPGHGPVLRSDSLVKAEIAVFRELLLRGREAKARGLDPDQAKAEILPALAAHRARFTRGDSGLDAAFEIYLVDWYLHRVYDELSGGLTDAIAPIPPS